MKPLQVVGAVIIEGGRVFCARRGGSGDIAGKWEFPGGKVEEGETPEEALLREFAEELLCSIRVGGLAHAEVYEHEAGAIALSTYYCEIVAGEPTLTEHSEMRWQPLASLDQLDWAPVNLGTVRALMDGAEATAS